jgi:hypothetical protein
MDDEIWMTMTDPRTRSQDYRCRCRLPSDADEQRLPEGGHAGGSPAGQHVPQPAVDLCRGSLELDEVFGDMIIPVPYDCLWIEEIVIV